MQVVTVKRGMHAEPVKKHLPFVGVSVIIDVVQFPDIRVNRREHVAPVREHTGHHAIDLLIEPLGKHLGDIGFAVIVGVLQQMNPLLDRHQVAPIVRAVAVPVCQPRLVLFAEFRRHLSSEHPAQLRDGLTRKIFDYPFLVTTNVNIHRATASGLHHVQPTLVVETQRDRIEQHRLPCPLRQAQRLVLQLKRNLNPRILPKRLAKPEGHPQDPDRAQCP